MTEITIYHNPRCTKSRQTLALLEDKGINPKVVEYLKTPLNKSEVADILQKLGKSPRDIIRKGEVEYKESGADNKDLSDEQLIEKIAQNPKLLERPIVVNNQKAAVGRPPENVLDIL